LAKLFTPGASVSTGSYITRGLSAYRPGLAPACADYPKPITGEGSTG